MFSKNKNTVGFTIVELLIVIVVIGILAAITVVAFNGTQQRARLSQVQMASAQIQKSLELSKAETGNYPSAVNSCPTPAADATCLTIPSGFTATYERLQPGARSAPVYAGITAQQSYELTLRSNMSVKYTSNAERTGTNEYLQYMNMAPIIDEFGLSQYEISFDIKSASTASASQVNVYMQNGSGAKYSFGVNVPVSTSYVRRSVTVVPTIWDATLTNSVLAFYGTYGTGNIPSVKNLEITKVK